VGVQRKQRTQSALEAILADLQQLRTGDPYRDFPAAENPTGASAHVDPQTLFIGDNVRDITDLNEDFIDSIRTYAQQQLSRYGKG
jgi:hypothetical protein